MSKKSKKARRPNVPMYTGPTAPAQPSAGGGETQALASRAGSAARETINADYTHVVSDLKRIGLLAGGLIAILVVLSFFIK